MECLNSVETYDPEKNRWALLPDMRQQRGRFNIAQVFFLNISSMSNY